MIANHTDEPVSASVAQLHDAAEPMIRALEAVLDGDVSCLTPDTLLKVQRAVAAATWTQFARDAWMPGGAT